MDVGRTEPAGEGLAFAHSIRTASYHIVFVVCGIECVSNIIFNDYIATIGTGSRIFQGILKAVWGNSNNIYIAFIQDVSLSLVDTCDGCDFCVNAKIRHIIIKARANDFVSIYDDCPVFVIKHRRFDGNLGGDI
jgi:hypothetical protein